MNVLKNRYLLFFVRIVLGGLFIYAAVPKIADPFLFSVQLYNYRLLPVPLVGLVAAVLPWVEFAAGMLLVVGFKPRAASCIVSCLLTIFTLALFINTLRGIDVECGCFAAERFIGWQSLVEDGLLTAVSFWYFICADSFLCIRA